MGFFAKNGKVITLKIIMTIWNPEENNKLLYTTIFLYYLSLLGSEISATLVNPEPDNIPIISKTLP